VLEPHRTDYVWLSQVYESVKPASGNGKLLWHALGAKTLDLVHRNVHVEEVRDDLDSLVMDADALEKIIETDDPGGKGKEIEIKIVARLRKHANNPEFVALGERLERLRERHEQGFVNSIEFLKALLSLARDVVEAEQSVDPLDEQVKAKAALTELFAETRNGDTPVIVERIVADIDNIVRIVRFPGWQGTKAGEREVQKALRKVVYVDYKIKDQDLFDRAFGYIRQYY
jgi:type I restriction enzyme R subunit